MQLQICCCHLPGQWRRPHAPGHYGRWLSAESVFLARKGGRATAHSVSFDVTGCSPFLRNVLFCVRCVSVCEIAEINQTEIQISAVASAMIDCCKFALHVFLLNQWVVHRNTIHIVSCRITSTSHHSGSHHITSHRITSHHITSHHITSPHITSHHITSPHLTSPHLTSHHIASHRIIKHVQFRER